MGARRASQQYMLQIKINPTREVEHNEQVPSTLRDNIYVLTLARLIKYFNYYPLEECKDLVIQAIKQPSIILIASEAKVKRVNEILLRRRDIVTKISKY